MGTRPHVVISAVGGTAFLALTLAGCTHTSPTPRVDPTYVDFTSAAQSGAPVVVEIPVGGGIEVFGSGTSNMEPKNWNVEITDPRVLAFLPADFSGRVARLPMLKGLKPGESTAVVTYTGGASPESVTYDVTVGNGS